MSADNDGKVSQNADNPMNHVGLDLDNLELTVLDFLNIPSPHITPYHMLDIYKKIKETAGQYDGVVITHGTDTLEETAYFLDTMAVPEIPIVLTGAMRSSNELGSDGVYNYLSALRVASDDKAADKGILVVMNDEIHAAKYVTKTHTTNVATFHTPTHGPLGIIMKHDILWFKTAEPRVRFDLEQITGTVPIIKAYAGMGIGDGIISLLDPEKIDGVVIEALGAGNLPPLAAREITSSYGQRSSLLYSFPVALTVSPNQSTPMKAGESNSKKLALCLSKNSTHQRLASNSSSHLVQDSKAKN